MFLSTFCKAAVWLIVGWIALAQPVAGLDSDSTVDLRSLSDTDLKTVTVRLERSRCYGTCPAYTVMIHGDGRVEYVGKNYVKTTGSQESQIQPEKIRSLLSEFENAKFLSLEDYSRPNCKGRVCTDMPTVIVELTVKGVKHVVNHYYGCGSAPKSLFDLETAIEKTVNTEQWTGDVSKQGPFGTTCFG